MDFAAQYPARTSSCQRFAHTLTNVCACDKEALRNWHLVTETHCPSLARFEWSVTECDKPGAQRQTFATSSAITPVTRGTRWFIGTIAINFDGRPQTDDELNFVIQQVFQQRRLML